jgi:uncharacterized membrane protein SpoIIM required for sporulation/uncharacterized RDD family membrane protein YckC
MPIAHSATFSTGAVTVSAQLLDQQVSVETPEQVVFSYTIAGVGSRAAAALIDTGICFGFMYVIWLAMPQAGRHMSTTSSWLRAGLALLVFVIFWGYHVLFEGLWDGQTPGKRRLGLRVVRDGGYSVGFAASAVRNLVRVIDMQPFISYGVGIGSVVLSSAGKRLGDYAAGTMVVRERAVTTGGGASAAMSRGPESTGMPSAALTDDEYVLLDRYIARRLTLSADRRAQLGQQLALRFRSRAPELTGTDSAVLVRLHEMERAARARGAAGRSGTGAAREQHAIVAQGSPRWREFAALLPSAQQRGLSGMSEAEVSDFVARYRELAGDLARLQTAARGRQIDSLFYLSRLVAGGHNLLYRERRVGWRAGWEYMTITVPREIRRSIRPIALAGAFLFGPAVIAYGAVVLHPAVAAELVPPGMLDRAEQGVLWAKRGEGYVDIPEDVRPMAASQIMSNNVWVSTLTFAGGMLAGLGTIAALVFNGVELGAVMGLYQTKGILPLIVAFIAPHGVLELSAITFAGAAGLLLASALLLPGALTRREALVVQGRRAIHLIAATVLMLVVAGTLEGLVSPIPWWTLEQKLTVSVLTAVLLLLYVNMDRGRDYGSQPSEVGGWERTEARPTGQGDLRGAS